MKLLWSGAIGFGQVNIPIKLFSAVRASELDLDMLYKTDLSTIKIRRVNEKTGQEVKWENIVKGSITFLFFIPTLKYLSSNYKHQHYCHNSPLGPEEIHIWFSNVCKQRNISTLQPSQ
jgi:hypothetical protein